MLPVINSEVHTTELPISKKVVKFRPYLSGEEKLIWIAKESNELKDMVSTLKQIIKNCTFGEVDCNTLSLIDFQHLSIMIRMKSYGDKIESKYVCEEVVDDKLCGGDIDITIPLEDVKLNHEPEKDKKIQVTGNVGIVMKYPSFKVIENTSDNPLDIEFFSEFIDCIYDSDTVHYIKDYTKKEVEDFFNSFPVPVLEEIREWISNVPQYVIQKEYECPKCKKKGLVEVSDLPNFF